MASEPANSRDVGNRTSRVCNSVISVMYTVRPWVNAGHRMSSTLRFGLSSKVIRCLIA